MSAHKKSPARRRRANTQPHKGVRIMPKHNSTATSGAQAKRAYRKPEILAETRGGEKRPADHLPLTREIESAALHLSGLINAGCPLNDDLRALKRVLLGAADMARALESRAIASAPEASSQGDSADGTRRELIYLAAPYSHPDPWVRQDRAGRITEAAARLIADGWAVFSPISHGVLPLRTGTAADRRRPGIGGETMAKNTYKQDEILEEPFDIRHLLRASSYICLLYTSRCV